MKNNQVDQSSRYFQLAILALTTIAGLVFYPKLALAAILVSIGWFSFTSKSAGCSICNTLLNPAQAGSASRLYSCYFPLFLFVVTLLLVMFREISLLTEPRFWAEDGRHYFEYAYSHGWWDTMTLRSEYQLLLSNISALISSKLVPLEHAPLPFTLAWLVVMSSIMAVIAWGKSPLWDTPLKKVVVSAIVLFAPRSAEIWFNANGAQYYTALLTALILCEPAAGSGRFRKYAYRFLLAAGSLHGLLSCLLTPLFWVRYLRDRNDRERAVQASILSIGATLQLLAIITAPEHAQRDILGRPEVLGWIAGVRTLGLTFSTELANIIYAPKSQPGYTVTEDFTRYGYILLTSWLLVLGLLAYRLRNSVGLYLLAAYIILFSFASVFGIGGIDNTALIIPTLGNRYFYASTALFLLVILASINPQPAADAGTAPLKTWPVIASVLLALGLANGIQEFYTEKVKLETWSSWQNEIALWREEPSRKLNIWPAPWLIQLVERRHD